LLRLDIIECELGALVASVAELLAILLVAAEGLVLNSLSNG